MLRLSLIALSLALTGCSAFRVEAGVGPTLGADVHLSGLIHTGVLGGLHIMTGSIYGKHCEAIGVVLTIPGFHAEWVGEVGHGGGSIYDHSSLGFLPPLTQGILYGLRKDRRARPWAFEVTVGLVFFAFRIGVDPIGALLEPEPASPTLP